MTHPAFGYKVSYRRLRLLAHHLLGELVEYPNFTTRQVVQQEHLYIVAYDIADPKHWRRVFRLMEGFGEWLQLSIFQCRLSRQKHAELIALLDGIIHHNDDRVILMMSD